MNSIIDSISQKLHNRLLKEYLDKEYGSLLYKYAKKYMNDYGETGLVKNEWLIHFPPSLEIAKNIVENGFSNGLSKDDLSVDTITISGKGKHEDQGYSYAYMVDDIVDSNPSLIANANNDCCVLFRANGVKFHNEYDNDTQVMFYNKAAKDRILLYRWEYGIEKGEEKYEDYDLGIGGVWGVGNVKNSPLYTSSFARLIQWVIENSHQYAKYLFGTDIPVGNEYHSVSQEKYYDKDWDNNIQDTSNLYNKWHNYEEEQNDMKNYYDDLTSFDAYKQFLKKNGVDYDDLENKVKSHLMSYLKQMSLNTDDEELKSIIKMQVENELERLGFSKKKFLDSVKPFLIRRRPDGQYWRY